MYNIKKNQYLLSVFQFQIKKRYNLSAPLLGLGGFVLFFTIFTNCNSKINPYIYYPDGVLEKIKPHKKIAIMPFDFVITDEKNKGNTETINFNLEKHQTDEALLFQENMHQNYLEFKTKNEKTQKNPIPQGFIPDKKIISPENFKYSDTLTQYSYKKLGTLLQTDAILIGKVQSYDDRYKGGRYGTEDKSKYNLDITYLLFDANTGEKLWQLQLSNIFDINTKQQSDNLEKNFDMLNQKAISFLPYFAK